MNNPLLSKTRSACSIFLVDAEPFVIKELESHIEKLFPDLELKGSATAIKAARTMIQQLRPNIIFFDFNLWKDYRFTAPPYGNHSSFETIILSDSNIKLMETIQDTVTGYLAKPVNIESLAFIVQRALNKIREKEENRLTRAFVKKMMQKIIQETPIGIPTIEGYEFLEVSEILWCQALRKYTRVVTKGKTDIVSAYNLGEFIHLLEPYGFFSPHRSYLVNLRHIKKYHKEGSIYMADGKCVPVSKRLKKTFLDLIQHL